MLHWLFKGALIQSNSTNLKRFLQKRVWCFLWRFYSIPHFIISSVTALQKAASFGMKMGCLKIWIAVLSLNCFSLCFCTQIWPLKLTSFSVCRWIGINQFLAIYFLHLRTILCTIQCHKKRKQITAICVTMTRYHDNQALDERPLFLLLATI